MQEIDAVHSITIYFSDTMIDIWVVVQLRSLPPKAENTAVVARRNVLLYIDYTCTRVVSRFRVPHSKMCETNAPSHARI